MSAHHILDPREHRDLRIRTEASAELGDAVMACLTVPNEFRRVQNDYPILFRRDLANGQFSALALFGFEQGENLFLQGGSWAARYKPLALSVQPLLVGHSRDSDSPSQVHIDLAHPRVSSDGQGVRLFGDEGSATPVLERAITMLGELDEGYRAAEGFYAALQRHDLLEPFSLDVELNDGAKHRLVGYHLIDEAKVMALSPGETGALHQEGHLMPMFMALASLSNIAKLVEYKNKALGLA